MTVQYTLTVEQVLAAARRHLADRHVCTIATSHRDVPWAASAFYVPRDLDVFVCQRKDARTLAQMLANPRTAFAVDDRKADAWFQALGSAAVVTGDDDRWARAQLQRAAPEFGRHFANPDFPILLVQVTEFTFVDRTGGITPRQQLVRRDGIWGFSG